MPNRVIKNLPNAITCANLFSGCVGIVFAFAGDLTIAAYAILVSAIFDFFDGFTARLLNAYAVTGKDLDSLADVVSFGVLPGAIVYQLFLHTTQIRNISNWLNFAAFLIPVFSALRLAKFNTDSRQTENFMGLPTPANAIFISSLPFILKSHPNYLINPYSLLAFTVIMCLFLVVDLPMMSLKFKNADFNKNFYRYLLLLFSAITILFFKFAAVPAIIFIYIMLSILQFTFSNTFQGRENQKGEEKR
jgi:CDP-diacylglycerol--serine O-phosphatidyltransferase